MSRQQRDKVKEIVRLLKPYKPERVILFGSYAWGKPNAASDVDLFIIKNARKTRYERMVEVGYLLYPASLPVDALVYTPAELRRRLEMGDMFVERVMRDGKEVYKSKPGVRRRKGVVRSR